MANIGLRIQIGFKWWVKPFIKVLIIYAYIRNMRPGEPKYMKLVSFMQRVMTSYGIIYGTKDN